MNEVKLNIYQENGYKDRQDYLECMADDYGLPLEVVQSLFDVLGDSEAFDGLVSALEDAEGMFE
jgi:hypothetical protein